MKFIGGGKQIEPYIKQLGNFADEANKQLIFEFLQNADDSNNDRIENRGIFGLFFNKKYLLAINNGKAFSADESGYLHKFLAGIGKANTDEDNSTTGKFGKGSKLLYNLLLDNRNTDLGKEEKRIKAISNELKGPIICSWKESGFIQELRTLEENDEISLHQDDTYTLVTKIIKAYYPAYTDEYQEDNNGNMINLFPKAELIELKDFMNSIQEDFLREFYERGSIVFIKLGDGQSEFVELQDDYKSAVKNYLSFSAKLSHIYFNNEKVEKTNLLSTGSINIETRAYEVLFPQKDQELKRNNFINFYNQLPIVKETHGLKFIINTDVFNILDTRQNIDFSDSSANARLEDIADVIFSFIIDETNSFRKRVMLYKSVLASDTTNSTKKEIKEFYHLLKEKIKTIAPVRQSFIKNENIVINDSNIEFELAEVGINNYKWLSPVMNNFYGEAKNKLGVAKWNFIEALNIAQKQSIKNWITNLDRYQYTKVLEELTKHIDKTYFSDIPFIKSSNQSIYSLEDVDNDRDFLLLSKTTYKVASRFIKEIGGTINEFPLDDEIIEDYINIDKLINFFNEHRNQISVDNKTMIVQFLSDYYTDEDETIRKDLVIFTNERNEFHSLNNLFSNRSLLETNELVKFALIKKKEDYPAHTNYYFEESQLWHRIINNWYTIKSDIEKILPFDTEGEKMYLNSINTVYSISNDEDAETTNLEMIPNAKGYLSQRNEIYLNPILSDFNEDDYHSLIAIFDLIDLDLPNYHTINIILNSPFLSSNSRIKQITDSVSSPLALDLKELILFKKLISKSFLANFTITKENDKYQLAINHNTTVYFSTDNKLNNFLEHENNYCLLPVELTELFQDDEILCNENNIINQLIESFGAQEAFIDVIRKADSRTSKELYLNAVEVLPLESTEDYNNSYEYKLLELSTSVEYFQISEKIYIDDERLTHYKFTNSVFVNTKDNVSHFKLSDILPEHQGKADVIEIVSSKFSNIQDSYKIFNLGTKNNDEILEELTGILNYSAMQLGFIICNNIAENYSIEANDCSLIDNQEVALLDFLYEYKLMQFCKYYSFGNLDFTKIILSTEEEFLCDIEKTPLWLKDWINNEKEKQTFLNKNGLESHQSIINFRKNYSDEYNVNHKNDKNFINNTLVWIRNKNTTLNEKAINNIKELIVSFVKGNNQLPDFLIMLNIRDSKLTKTLKPVSNTTCFTNNYHSYKNQIIELINDFNFPYQIIDNSYPKVDEEILKSEDIFELEINSKLAQDKLSSINEWDADYYEEWRETKEGEEYKISISNNDVPLNYKAIIDDFETDIDFVGGGDYSNTKIDRINLIYLSNKFITTQNKPILSILEELKSKIQLYPSDLLKLNKIYIEQSEEMNSAVKQLGLSSVELSELSQNKTRLNSVLKNIKSGKGGGDYSFSRDISQNEQGLLEKLFKMFDSKDVEKLLNNPKRLKDFLEGKENEEDATINKLIGFIGEMVFKTYLSITKQDYKYTAKEIAAYDFTVDDKYIDTKTTMKPIKEASGTVPFYIKQTQYRFLNNERPQNYFIARLSLSDLGLIDLYNAYKNEIVDNDIPVEIEDEIEEKIFIHYQDNQEFEILKDTMMTFKLNYDDYFKVEM